MKTVYLAGPIAGCSEGEAKDWRTTVADALKAEGIVGVSPLRCEPILGEKYEAAYADPKFGTSSAIGSKNFFDVQSCDMVLAYMPTPAWARHHSYGTLLELGWAHALRKPILLVSRDFELREHAVVEFNCNWILWTLDDAVETIVGVLGAYVEGGKHV